MHSPLHCGCVFFLVPLLSGTAAIYRQGNPGDITRFWRLQEAAAAGFDKMVYLGAKIM